MKIFRINIKNYRLLKNLSLDIEEELSLVIGKNNTGKTSILSVLDKFLSKDRVLTQSDKNKFSVDDFNIDFKKQLKDIIENPTPISEDLFKEQGINLRLFIEYETGDNLSNISRVMMDLDPSNNMIVLGYGYTLNYEDYIKLRTEYKSFEIKEQQKQKDKKKENIVYNPKGFFDFLKLNLSDYFKLSKKTFEIDKTTKEINEERFINLIKEGISTKEIINFKYIPARRGVNNNGTDKSLSTQTSTMYGKKEVGEDQSQIIDVFKDKLTEVDTSLSDVYKVLFSSTIDKIKKFGGVRIDESEIAIISTLQHRELLEGNTTVVYKHDANNQLPEHYNGLGYMNLISMIFDIEILVEEFKREKEEKLCDINLLFIEEPEAHTHPQMQYIFIKNIKTLLGDGISRVDGQHRRLQYIVSTHSSHIVADSEFDDIKYLKRESVGSVVAKNLKELKEKYKTETAQYEFLKQYLTVNRAEIFFADKVVLIEGDTEKILIPTMMNKIDIEESKTGTPSSSLPLLSQNISIVEVGAYSQIFENFIEFVGIKTLIITDLDTVKPEVNAEGKTKNVACQVSEGKDYSNSALKHFFKESKDGKTYVNKTLDELKGYTITNKVLNKSGCEICIVYQTEQNGYSPRSFEDAFLNINKQFVIDNMLTFRSLKNKEYFSLATKTVYDLALECIEKKTHFALDILFHSNKDLDNWKIPAYIQEGLIWLKQD